MKTYISAIILSSCIAGFSSTASFAQTVVPGAVEDVKTRVYEAIGKDTATISFEKGKHVVSESERSNLAAVVSAVRSNADISKAVIAAWSDKEYPMKKDQALEKSDRRLANQRAESVRESLMNLGVRDVEIHSMAEHPNWFGRLFNTEDTVVKGEGKIKDINDEHIAEIGRVLRDKGGPGKAVVILRQKAAKSAH